MHVSSSVPFPELARIPTLSRLGGITGAEAFAHHRPLIGARSDEYDPRVAKRLLLAEAMSAAEYLDLLRTRAEMIASAQHIATPYDALIAPAVPIVAPPIVMMEQDDAAFAQKNGMVLRNTSLFNFLDCCALSIPCHRAGEAPVGLMVIGMSGTDRRILQTGLAIETVIAPDR